MRPALRFLLVFAGVVCLCMPALHAFTLGKMPQSADGLIQLQRTVALEHALRVDHPLWPRFASGLVYGYGAPLFNYFPPLSYMPASLLQILGAGALSSLLLMMGAYTVTAGVGMFLLGRLWTRSTLGGWVGATAYVYAPYLLFDSLTRGASAELAALAVLPFALYGFTRLATIWTAAGLSRRAARLLRFHSLAHACHFAWHGNADAVLPLLDLARR